MSKKGKKLPNWAEPMYVSFATNEACKDCALAVTKKWEWRPDVAECKMFADKPQGIAFRGEPCKYYISRQEAQSIFDKS